MTKRVVLVALAGILFIAVSGCSLGSGGTDGVDSIVDPSGTTPIGDGWFTDDGNETFDEDDADVTAGDDTEIVEDEDVTEPTSDEETLSDVKAWIPTVGKVDLLTSGDRPRPRTTAIPIDSDDGPEPPVDTESSDTVPGSDVEEGAPTADGVARGATRPVGDDDDIDDNVVIGSAAATDSEIKELELTLWTGPDDAARLKKSKAWFQFCSDKSLETCSEKFLLNETNDDFQAGSVATLNIRPYSFGDYFSEADSVREKTQYFKISLEKKGKDIWELEGVKLIYVKHDGTRELAYFNPCAHKWLKKSSHVRFGPNDTATCAVIVGSDADPDLDDSTVVLDFEDYGHAIESGNNTCNKNSPHFRPGHDDFYMGFKGYNDWKASAVRSYGDWSFDSDPFGTDDTGIPGGFSAKLIDTSTCSGFGGCVFDTAVWGFERITVYIYRPADNFKIRTSYVTGLEEIVPAQKLFVADTFGRDDINEGSDKYDHQNYLAGFDDRYPISESRWVDFKQTTVFEYEDFGPEALGGIDYTLGTNPAI